MRTPLAHPPQLTSQVVIRVKSTPQPPGVGPFWHDYRQHASIRWYDDQLGTFREHDVWTQLQILAMAWRLSGFESHLEAGGFEVARIPASRRVELMVTCTRA